MIKISNGVKPRILIFSIAYEPLVGGAELAVRDITDRLSSYEFDLITCRFARAHSAFEKIGNVNVYRVGFGNRLGRFLYPALAFRLARKLHRQRSYQIVWAIMAAYGGAAALLFLRRFPSIKFLLTLQEGDSIAHIHKRVRGMRQRWQQIFRRADQVQAISKFLASWAREEGAKAPISIIPNGVDLENFKIAREARPAKGEFDASLITTSRLVSKNGVDILIKAVAELRKLVPEKRIHLRILGVGPEEKKLKSLAQSLGLEKSVEFIGIVGAKEIPVHLRSADIFVRPSRSEGLGSAFLEAMAAGLPVIGTPVGGIPDFLVDQETGLFCKVDDPKDLAEKINRILTDGDLRQKLAANGRNLVRESYDWAKIGRQMELIFKNLSHG